MKSYTPEFRQQVVDFVMQNPRMKLADIANDFDIPKTTLHGWLSGKGLNNKSSNTGLGSPELIEARKRIRELEQENIILKKAAAYFAGEMRPK